MLLVEPTMKFPEARCALHSSISELVKQLQLEVVNVTDDLAVKRTVTLIRSGSLNYWVSNLADICRSRWDSAHHSVTESGLGSSEFARYAAQVALPSMFALNTASQDPSWNSALERLISAYKHDSLVGLQHKQPQFVEPIPTDEEVLDQPFVGQSVKVFTSYLPRAVEVLISLRMGSIPRRWKEPKIRSAAFDVGRRTAISFQESLAVKGTFEHFFRGLLPFFLPLSVVENLEAICDALPDYKDRIPRAVFTANLHVSSDSFVIWMSHVRARGTKILLSQHGGLNGQGRIATRGEEFESQYADKYLNWGWYRAPNSRLFPTQINLYRRRRRSSNRRKILLMITDCTYRLSRRPWADSLDNERYRSMLLSTYANLSTSMRSHVIVRLHHDHAKYDESHRDMWMSAFDGVRIDDGVSRIDSLRRKSKLVVCTTLGTSEIEQFARSIPTVLRIDPVVHALRDSSIDIFSAMESVGIVHWSTESLTNFIHENFEDIDRWWSSDEVQTVINKYLARFGHQSRRPIRDVLSVLKGLGD